MNEMTVAPQSQEIQIEKIEFKTPRERISKFFRNRALLIVITIVVLLFLLIVTIQTLQG